MSPTAHIQGKAVRPPCFIEGTRAEALVDSGATTQFVDSDFLKRHDLEHLATPKQTVDRVEMADGSIRLLTHEVRLTIIIGDHIEEVLCQVTHLSPAPLILGMTWLEAHNPHIDWVANTVHFNKPE